MPTETFFRLNESKQERIINAIKDEITRSSYEDFSIGNVVKQSGISRGSFYQYFHNKDDIYRYLLEEYRTDIQQYARKSISDNGGDFFNMIEMTFRFTARMLCYRDSKSFRYHLFCNRPMLKLITMQGDYIGEEEKIFDIQNLREDINFDLLSFEDETDLERLFNICIITALRDLAGIFISDDKEQHVLENFLPKLELLRRAYHAPQQ